jgi:hypothetical protein
MSPATAGIRWVRPPSELAAAIDKYGDKVLMAVAAVAQYVATEMENTAKETATWTDRTGNARTGLFGTAEADFAGHVVVLYLSHGATIDYGLMLETRGGGRYAVINRTMQSHYGELMDMLRGIFD